MNHDSWLEYRPTVALIVGNPTLARQYLDEIPSAQGASPAMQAVEGQLLLAEGRVDEAVALASSLVQQHPTGFHPVWGPYVMLLGRALFVSGEVDAAREVVAPLIPVLEGLQALLSTLYLSWAHLISGDREAGIAALHLAQMAGVNVPSFVRTNALFGLRADDPEVQTILTDMEREVEILRRRADARVAELRR